MTADEAAREVQAAQAGLASALAQQRRLELRRLEHICPICIEPMTARDFKRVRVYRCRDCRFYRQVSLERL